MGVVVGVVVLFLAGFGVALETAVGSSLSNLATPRSEYYKKHENKIQLNVSSEKFVSSPSYSPLPLTLLSLLLCSPPPSSLILLSSNIRFSGTFCSNCRHMHFRRHRLLRVRPLVHRRRGVRISCPSGMQQICKYISKITLIIR